MCFFFFKKLKKFLVSYFWLLWVFITTRGLSLVGTKDGVITDLEPDILECEVKWALESITMTPYRTNLFG